MFSLSCRLGADSVHSGHISPWHRGRVMQQAVGSESPGKHCPMFSKVVKVLWGLAVGVGATDCTSPQETWDYIRYLDQDIAAAWLDVLGRRACLKEVSLLFKAACASGAGSEPAASRGPRAVVPVLAFAGFGPREPRRELGKVRSRLAFTVTSRGSRLELGLRRMRALWSRHGSGDATLFVFHRPGRRRNGCCRGLPSG